MTEFGYPARIWGLTERVEFCAPKARRRWPVRGSFLMVSTKRARKKKIALLER